MTYIQQIIEKAIEGGFYIPPTKEGWKANVDFQFALLNPLFWQSLGKSLGWYFKKEEWESYPPMFEWQWHWHSFIDHLAEGKDAESFFKELLS